MEIDQLSRDANAAFGVLLTLDGAGTSPAPIGELGGTAIAPVVEQLVARGHVEALPGGYQLTDSGAASLERFARQKPRPTGWSQCEPCKGRGIVRGSDDLVRRCDNCNGAGSTPL